MNSELKTTLKTELIVAGITFLLLSFLTIFVVGICKFMSDDSEFDCYTFTSFADGSPLYIRKDCICTITTVSGDVYIVPTNGSSVRVRESMDEVKKITGIK